MPRMTINLLANNIEQLEFNSSELKDFLEHPNPHTNIREKVETALEEAFLQIDQEGSELEYVVIKIVKERGDDIGR